jgi:ketol-acid reductoisomerase
MQKILEEIQKGEFAKEYIKECESGNPVLTKNRKETDESFIEKVGNTLRSMMPWLKGSEKNREQHTGQTISGMAAKSEPAKKS